MATHTLSKAERLKKRTEIAAVFARGKMLVQPPIKLLYLLQPAAVANLQMGVVASKKLFKKAVHRNRVKRLIREAYRTQNAPIKQLMATKQLAVQLFFIYQAKELPRFLVVQQIVAKLLEKLTDKLEKHV